MKKLVLKSALALSMAFFAFSAQAQLNKGDKQVNLGVGLFGLGFNATAQYGIMDDLGVGLYVGYERNTFGLGLVGLGNYSTNTIMAGPIGTYHFNRVLNMKSDKFDLYASAGALLHSVSYSKEWRALNNNNTNIDFGVLARVGGKYNFSEKMSIFGDIGYGGSWLQGGISFKF